MKLILISLFLIPSALFAKVYEIPIYDSPREPLVIIQNGKYSGLFIEAFETILKRAGIEYKFIPLPHQRRRQAFVDGQYLIECCSNESWRTRPEEVSIQKFSKGFYTVRDILIKSSSVKYDALNKNNYKFALVTGYDYGGFEKDLKFVTRLANEKTLLEFLVKGRAEIGIIDEMIFSYHQQIFKYISQVEVFKESQIKIRVNKNNPELLVKIDKAITELERENIFEKIRFKYLTPTKGQLSQIEQVPLLSSLEEDQ